MTNSTPKLFVLEASGGGRLFTINPDGSDKTILVSGCPVPDGVAVDVEAGHIYWTNMGVPPKNDGSIAVELRISPISCTDYRGIEEEGYDRSRTTASTFSSTARANERRRFS